MTCPPDTSRVIEVNSGPVPVFFQRPTATDNSMVTPTVVSQSHSSGDLFDVGKTTVVFLYADLAGNQNQCSFCIEVLERKCVFNLPFSSIKTNPKSNSDYLEQVNAHIKWFFW